MRQSVWFVWAACGALLACAPRAPVELPWQGARLTRAACHEADSIVRTGPQAPLHRYQWALASLPKCTHRGWSELALAWHRERASTDTSFLWLLHGASDPPIQGPALDTLLAIVGDDSASAPVRRIALRTLVDWRVPGFVNELTDTLTDAGLPRCTLWSITDVARDPPPASIARRIDHLLIEVDRPSVPWEVRGLTECYLSDLADGLGGTPDPEVESWAHTYRP